MFCSLIARGEGRSWRSERSWRNDEFCALFGKSRYDMSRVAATDLEHTLWYYLVSNLSNHLFLKSVYAIGDDVVGIRSA
jgi:hypothetical protein